MDKDVMRSAPEAPHDRGITPVRQASVPGEYLGTMAPIEIRQAEPRQIGPPMMDGMQVVVEVEQRKRTAMLHDGHTMFGNRCGAMLRLDNRPLGDIGAQSGQAPACGSTGNWCQGRHRSLGATYVARRRLFDGRM